MSDGGFDPDEMITRSREEENLFGTVVDPITKQYVSYPAVPGSNDVGKIEDDFSRKPGQPKNVPGKQEPLSENRPEADEQKSLPQSEEGNSPQNWTLAGKNRESVAYKWVARGNTYPVRELLKEARMRWDPKHREWYSHKKPDIEIEGIYMMKTKA